MLKLLAKPAAALSLTLSAGFAVPAWAGDSADDRKCTAQHRQSKPVVTATAPVARAAPARGLTVVEKRKLEVQILSFGP